MNSTDTFETELGILTRRLFQLISQGQKPKPLDPNWARNMRQQAAELSQQMKALLARFHDSRQRFSQRFRASLERMANDLETYARELSNNSSKARLKDLYRRMTRSYEELVAQARKQGVLAPSGRVRTEHLKPVNYMRNIFHMCNGTIAFFLYHFVLTRSQALWILGVLMVLAAFMEISRKFWPTWNDFLIDKVFGLVSRPKERHTVNSATYYLISLLMVTLLLPQPAVEIAILVLAYGDPFASIIGKKWGKRKIHNQKSLEGTLAFFVTSLIVTGLYSAYGVDGLSVMKRFFLAISIASAGTLAELYSDRLDDNFSILAFCGVIATLFFL